MKHCGCVTSRFAKALHIHQEGSNVVRADLLTNAIKVELVEKHRWGSKKLLSGIR